MLQEKLDKFDRSGLLAEKMVKTFLKKIALDADLDFSIENATAHEDVEKATDFYVHVKRPEHKKIAVQFTVRMSEQSRREKEARIARLGEPVVVVQGGIGASPRQLMTDWASLKSPVKGPMQFIPHANKLSLARAVLEKVLPPDLCEENMAKIEEALKKEEASLS
jgi:hypothetical protein